MRHVRVIDTSPLVLRPHNRKRHRPHLDSGLDLARAELALEVAFRQKYHHEFGLAESFEVELAPIVVQDPLP